MSTPTTTISANAATMAVAAIGVDLCPSVNQVAGITCE